MFQDKPTIYFYPQDNGCRQGDLKVLKSRKKTVVTLDIGPFCAKETISNSGADTIVKDRENLVDSV
jgi:hypothetical protein